MNNHDNLIVFNTIGRGTRPMVVDMTNSHPTGLNNIQIKCSFDWFSFTTDKILYKDNYLCNSYETLLKYNTNDELLNKIVRLLNNNSFNYDKYELHKGNASRGYLYYSDIDENINVNFYGPRSKNYEITTLFNLSGKGCYFYSLNKNYSKVWYDLFYEVIHNNMSATRLDIAYDFIGGIEVENFIKWLIEKIKVGSCRTRWKKKYNNEQISENGGYSLYLGSKDSGSRIRIYNKNAEKIAKDKNAFIENNNYWRLEIEIRKSDNDNVNNFLKEYLVFFQNNNFDDTRKLTNFLAQFLNSYLEVRNIENGVAIKNAPVDEFWYDFISSLGEKIEFKLEKNNLRSSVEIKKNWLERSCFKAMCQIYCCYGEIYFKQWLESNILGSMKEFDDLDKFQIKNFYIQNGIKNNLVIDNKFNENELNNIIEKFEVKRNV